MRYHVRFPPHRTLPPALVPNYFWVNKLRMENKMSDCGMNPGRSAQNGIAQPICQLLLFVLIGMPS